MKKIIATIYWVYVNKKNDLPYLSTALTVIGLVFIHVCQIILALKIPARYIFPFRSENQIQERWINAILFLTPLLFLFFLMFKKKTLAETKIADQNIKKGKKIIPIYFIVSFSLLVFLLIQEGIRHGKI